MDNAAEQANTVKEDSKSEPLLARSFTKSLAAKRTRNARAGAGQVQERVPMIRLKSPLPTNTGYVWDETTGSLVTIAAHRKAMREKLNSPL